MYVYPRQVDTARIQMICRAVSGMVLSRNRLYEDPFEFSGIRDYRKEDPMNRINWKSSARMGDLMVNQFDATTSVEVTVLLDIEDANILREKRRSREHPHHVFACGADGEKQDESVGEEQCER